MKCAHFLQVGLICLVAWVAWWNSGLLLASRGFAALALAYFAYEDLPENPPAINMDYFEEAANWLIHHPKVLPHSIGIHAICYGSWIALLIASLNMKAVKTVVAIFPKISTYVKPFTYKGNISEVIPFDYSKRIPTEEGYIWRYSHYSKVGEYSAAHTQHSAITLVEHISCPVLLVYGTVSFVVAL